MARRKLFPKPGDSYLPPSEVIVRLQSHFNHVEVDARQGEVVVNQMVDQLTRMQFLEPPPATPEDIERLRSHRGEAVSVTFADDPDSENAWLTTTLIPSEPLFFGFASGHHEDASMPLLERCASILGYDIHHG